MGEDVERKKEEKEVGKMKERGGKSERGKTREEG